MNDGTRRNISIPSWKDVRLEVFAQLSNEAPTQAEVEHRLKEIAQELGVSLPAIRKDYQAYLQGDPPQQATRRSAATEAFLLVIGQAPDLWKTPGNVAYASFIVPDDAGNADAYHVEHHPIMSGAFRSWVRMVYYQSTGKTLGSQALADALGHLEAEAVFRGRTHTVCNRIGAHEGKIYLDLGTPDWSMVEVSAQGWRVIRSDAAPVRFQRVPLQKPLPEPVPSSDGLDTILALMNLKDRRDTVAVKGWLIGALNPNGNYPILMLKGEKGAGKSTVALMIKMLLDPTEAPLRYEPQNVDDLVVSATKNHVIAFDNLSGIQPWLSDAFCRLSTGGGLGKRKHYTDGDEVVLDARLPVVLTGIAFGTLRDDLADRTLTVELTRIEDCARRTDDELWATFQTHHARALGQLLTAVSEALKHYDATRQRLSAIPRMSTWAVWAEAAAAALGLEPGEIIQAYYGIQAEYNQDVVETDPIAGAILNLWNTLREGETRSYTTGDLLHALEATLPGGEMSTKPDGWPRTAQGLGRRLPRLLTALRSVGVHISSYRDGDTKNYVWSITKATQAPTPPPPAPTPTTTNKDAGQGASTATPATPPTPSTQQAPLETQSALPFLGEALNGVPPSQAGKRKARSAREDTPTPDRPLRKVRLDGDLYRGRGYNPDIIKEGGEVEF